MESDSPMNRQQDERLGTAPLAGLMVSLAVPSVIAQLINVLYNIVDRIYIGHIAGIGSTALTGVGVSFPIITLVSAFSYLIGSGGAPLASIALGKKDRERAERILGSGTAMLLLFSVLLTVFFEALGEPLLYMFGASDGTVGYGLSYIRIYLIGTVFVQISLGLNLFISSQGQAKTAMLSVLIGAVLNIVLDPLFIFVFGMGVEGAALATILSQAVSAAWVLRFLISEKSSIRLRRRSLRFDGPIIKSVLALGVAPFIMSATESAITIVLNRGLQAYGGDLYVGSMTILQSVMQLIAVPINGFTSGVQPIISFNFGARKFDRVKKTCYMAILVAFAAASLCCLACVFLPGVFAGMFTSDAELIALTARVLPIYIAGVWLFGVQMGCQACFMGLGQAKIATFIAILRKLVLLIPLAILLPRVFGVMGIYWAEPISDITAASTAGLIFLFRHKKIISEETLERIR